MFYKILGVVLILISSLVQAECGSLSCHLPTKLHHQQKVEPELFIFVSFNMPEQSLKHWAEEANRVGGTLLLRGFDDNSLEKTTIKVKEIFGEDNNVEMSIDPERFQQFKIDVVPAVVIVEPKPDSSDLALTPSFDVVYGDTSLEEALQQIAKTGTSEGQKVASQFLKRYRGEA